MASQGVGHNLATDTFMLHLIKGFPGVLVVKNLPANAGDIRDVG